MEARPQRNRSQVARFAPVEAKAEKAALEIAPGAGVPIADNAFVVDQLAKLKADDDVVKNVHQLFFRQPGTKANRKKNIRQFSGYPEGAASRAAHVERIAGNRTKYTVAALKDMCGLLGLEKSGSREELIERLVDFAVEPTATKAKGTKRKAVSSSGGRKTKGKRAKKAGKKGSRGPNSYMVFLKEIRPSVVAENPGLDVKEIARIIGERWNALSAAEKEEYKAKAAALKAERAGADDDNEDEGDENEENEEEEDEEEGKEAEDGDDEDA